VRLLDGRSIKIRKSAFDLLRDGEVIESPRFDSVPNSPRVSTPSSTNSRPYKAMSNEPPPLSLSGEEIPYPTSSSYAGALQHRNRQRCNVKPLHPHINNYDDALDEEEDDEEEEADYEEDSEEDEQVTAYPFCDHHRSNKYEQLRNFFFFQYSCTRRATNGRPITTAQPRSLGSADGTYTHFLRTGF
jgi:hypothetical protein